MLFGQRCYFIFIVIRSMRRYMLQVFIVLAIATSVFGAIHLDSCDKSNGGEKKILYA